MCLARWPASIAIPWVLTGAWTRPTLEFAGRWHYSYRAIDELGQIVDAYVSPTRDMSLQDAPLFNLIIALAQIPGYFSAAYLVDRLGRKLTLVTCSVRRSVPTSLAASRRCWLETSRPS